MAIEVQTTQNVTIDYEPAGIGYRLLAYIADWAVIIVWAIGWVGLFYYLDAFDTLGDGDSPISMGLGILAIVPALFYDLIFETLNNGQSPGKMLFKIRVVNIDGTVPSFGSYLLRWLFRLVDFAITEGILGIIMIVATDKSQRLGDYLAGTTVIDLKVSAKNKELALSELEFHEDYKVTYTDVLSKLSDKDIQTVRSILEDDNMQQSDYFTKRLSEKIKLITGYTYDGSDTVFLRKIVSDYNYLALL